MMKTAEQSVEKTIKVVFAKKTATRATTAENIVTTLILMQKMTRMVFLSDYLPISKTKRK